MTQPTTVTEVVVQVDGVNWQKWDDVPVNQVYAGMCYPLEVGDNTLTTCEVVRIQDVSHTGDITDWRPPVWWSSLDGWEEDHEYIETMVEDMRKGDVFPPVTVVRLDGQLWWDDGAHRMTAAYLLGARHVQAYVIEAVR